MPIFTIARKTLSILAICCFVPLATAAEEVADPPPTSVHPQDRLIIKVSSDGAALDLQIDIDDTGRFHQTGTITRGDTIIDAEERGLLVRQGNDLLKIYDSNSGGWMRWTVTEQTASTYTIEECIGIEDVEIQRQRVQ